jgi:hypothetical protein
MSGRDFDPVDLVDDRVFQMARRVARVSAENEQLEARLATSHGPERSGLTVKRPSPPVATAPRRPSVPRLALSKTEAAHALGVSVDFFDEHLAHEIRCIRRGRRRLYAVRDLEAWLERESDGSHLRRLP